MAKFRVHRTKDYTTMSNTHFREKQMSLKAKGLLSLMLSLPEEWDYSEIGLSKLSKDGVGSTATALDELEQFGYLKRTQSKDNNGKFSGYDYDIFEKPQTTSPYTKNPFTEKPFTGNSAQYNTKELDNISNNDNIHAKTKRINPPKVVDVSDEMTRIFVFWNEKKIIPHRAITPEIMEALKKALRLYKEDEICTFIDRYSTVISDKNYFWHYKWSLKDFLLRKDGISSFADDGSKWVSYCDFKKEPKPTTKKTTTVETPKFSTFSSEDAFERALRRSYEDE